VRAIATKATDGRRNRLPGALFRVVFTTIGRDNSSCVLVVQEFCGQGQSSCWLLGTAAAGFGANRFRQRGGGKREPLRARSTQPPFAQRNPLLLNATPSCSTQPPLAQRNPHLPNATPLCPTQPCPTQPCPTQPCPTEGSAGPPPPEPRFGSASSDDKLGSESSLATGAA
jgi:hypothetical protein